MVEQRLGKCWVRVELGLGKDLGKDGYVLGRGWAKIGQWLARV